MIKQVKFTYSSLRKDFEKQIETFEDQGKKTSWSLKILKPVELNN